MKKTLALLLALALAFIAGCQATPEDPIVTGKSSDALIEKAQGDAGEGALAEKLGAPARYTGSAASADGKLTVTIDAAVTVPEAEKIPIWRVKDGSITQEQADALIRGLVRTTLYDPDQPMTKDEVMEKLLEAKQQLAEGPSEQEAGAIYMTVGDEAGENGTMTWEEHMQDTIDRLTEQYESAPETVQPKPISGQFEPLDENAESILGKGYEEDVGYESLSVSNNHWQTGMSTAHYYRGDSGTYVSGTLLSREEIAQRYPDFDLSTLPELSITERAAAELGDALVDTLDIPGMSLYSARKLYDTAALAFPDQDLPVRCRWVLRYTRVVDGVPITYAGNLMTVALTDDGVFRMPWGYETLCLYVGDDGIDELRWEAPYALTETVTGDSALLPFGDIMDIFEKMYVVQNDGRAMDVAVSDIRLGYTRVLKQDEDGVGLLVPAWDFFGTVSYENKLAYAQPDDSLFTINAIDGTVIDRSLGY